MCVWLGGRWVVLRVLGGVWRCVCGWVPGWWVWLGSGWCVVAGERVWEVGGYQGAGWCVALCVVALCVWLGGWAVGGYKGLP